MTLTAEAIQRLEEIAVRFSPDGAPLAVRYDGGIWAVDPDAGAAHWFGRGSGRDGRAPAATDSEHLASVENWRLQARLNSASALLTFHLQRSPGSASWFLADITDASGRVPVSAVAAASRPGRVRLGPERFDRAGDAPAVQVPDRRKMRSRDS